MDKKNLTIVILFLIIIGLVWFIFAGNSSTQAIIEEISGQRNELIRSTTIIESELDKSIGENTQLEKDNLELRDNNTELEQIIDNLSIGNKKTENYLSEYGRITTDFARFLQQATITD